MTKEFRSASIFIILFLAFVWGSSFILMKKGLEVYSPNQVAALRIFISFLALLPFAVKNLGKLRGIQLLYIAMAGFLGSGIPAFLFTTAQHYINSSMAGILNALTPLFTLIFAVTLFRTRVSFVNVLGIILGFAGAATLIIKDFTVFFDSNNIYGLLIVVATFLYGYNSNHVKHRLKDLDGISITALSFFVMGPFAGIYLLFSSVAEPMLAPGGLRALGFVSILAVVGTALAMVLWNNLIKKLPVIVASSVTYIIPVFAIMWGIIDGESFSLREGMAALLIFLGIYLVTRKHDDLT